MQATWLDFMECQRYLTGVTWVLRYRISTCPFRLGISLGGCVQISSPKYRLVQCYCDVITNERSKLAFCSRDMNFRWWSQMWTLVVFKNPDHVSIIANVSLVSLWFVTYDRRSIPHGATLQYGVVVILCKYCFNIFRRPHLFSFLSVRIAKYRTHRHC